MKFIFPSFHFWVCKFRLFAARLSSFTTNHTKTAVSVLLVTPIFHVSCRTLGLAFVKSTKESYRIGQHFNSPLAFRKIIDEYAHHAWNPWKSELNEHSSTPNTKFDKVTLPSRHRPLFVRHYRAKYFLTRSLIIKMCSIIVLKRKKLEGYNHVYF